MHIDTFNLCFIEHNDHFNLYLLLDWWSVKYTHITTFYMYVHYFHMYDFDTMISWNTKVY